MADVAISPQPVLAPPALEASEAPAGSLTLLLGSAAQLTALETGLVLETLAQGQDVAMVCGDNRLDAYGLLAKARARGLEQDAADGVWLARAFTVHQFVALLEETLPWLAREREAGLVLVTGLLAPFLDEDVAPSEGRVLLARTMRRLRAWSAGAGARVVATAEPSLDPRAASLMALAREGAARCVERRPDAAAASRAWRPLESFLEAP